MSICHVCPHHCDITEGHVGFCGARRCVNGTVICDNYGYLTSMALDPIEKKPLNRFMSGTNVLSVGSYGCNLRCAFCQNHDISMRRTSDHARYVSPDELIDTALSLRNRGNIGVAYTYNEPLIGYEYICDCSVLAHTHGLKNVVITNGYIDERPLVELLPHIDALNIDYKGGAAFYKRIRGDVDVVRRSIALAAQWCHVEVTTLVIPDENDTLDDILEIAQFLASVDARIPLHISRYFPRYQYDKPATDVDTIYALADAARDVLQYVWTGNC